VKKTFKWLNISQFTGAFNDNAATGTLASYRIAHVPAAGTKGEQLAVCYTDEAGDATSLISKLRENGLPNLWIPRTANFFRIPELPILGTGKLDFCAIQTLVNQ
jgi:hypothetical protein